MKKTLLFAASLLVAMPSFAGWEQFESSASGTHYFDPSTIKSKGKVIKSWRRLELLKQANDGTLSTSFLSEVNCADKTSNVTRELLYSERNLKGTVKENYYTSGFSDIAPGTVDETFFKIVCGRR